MIPNRKYPKIVETSFFLINSIYIKELFLLIALSFGRIVFQSRNLFPPLPCPTCAINFGGYRGRAEFIFTPLCPSYSCHFSSSLPPLFARFSVIPPGPAIQSRETNLVKASALIRAGRLQN